MTPSNGRRVAVFCGASSGASEAYERGARAVGRGLVERGYGLVYGGGSTGLMGAVADAALEAGGEVIGVIPEILCIREVAHQGLARLETVADMHARKKRMYELSDAFIALPGGLGTLDETMEMLTWRQLEVHDRPVWFLDQDSYWQPWLALFDHLVEEGFAREAARRLFRVATEPEELLELLTRDLGEAGN